MSIWQKRLKELATPSDHEIDYSDIPDLDENFWQNARIVEPKIRSDSSRSASTWTWWTGSRRPARVIKAA